MQTLATWVSPASPRVQIPVGGREGRIPRRETRCAARQTAWNDVSGAINGVQGAINRVQEALKRVLGASPSVARSLKAAFPFIHASEVSNFSVLLGVNSVLRASSCVERPFPRVLSASSRVETLSARAEGTLPGVAGQSAALDGKGTSDPLWFSNVRVAPHWTCLLKTWVSFGKPSVPRQKAACTECVPASSFDACCRNFYNPTVAQSLLWVLARAPKN